MLALSRLVSEGSHHPDLPVTAYGGDLFAPGGRRRCGRPLPSALRLRERLFRSRSAAGPRRPPDAPAPHIAPILGFLRDLQRRFETAVLLVHHSRKSAATRPGQALRGTSELHAWGDSNLYLRRRDHQIVMTVEHRAARGLNDIEIELADDGQGAALRLRRQGPSEAGAGAAHR